MKEHGPWRILRSGEVYRDPWTLVTRDDVIRPDGRPGTYTVVHIKPGVCVAALDDEEHLYLAEEFHYAVGRTTVEGVSGGIEEGEDAPGTARRELKEEIGIEAAEWTDLGSVDPFTSNVLSPTRLFLARGLTLGAHDQEGTERIRRVRHPLAAAVRMALDGTISHAPSCVLIFKIWWHVRGPRGGLPG